MHAHLVLALQKHFYNCAYNTGRTAFFVYSLDSGMLGVRIVTPGGPCYGI